jgi:diguanylate cyclase (GGDEF)-like protein
MPQHWKLRVLIVLAVGTITAAVLTVTSLDRADERRDSERTLAGQRMLSALIDAQAALHSYAGDRETEHLVDFGVARRAYALAQRDAYAANDDPDGLESLRRQDEIAASYLRAGSSVIERASRATPGNLLSPRRNHQLLELVARFEDENARFLADVQQERHEAVSRTRWLSAAVVIGLSLVFALLGQVLISRSHRRDKARHTREREHRADQREFAEVLQVTESESEAYELIKRHLERSLPEATVTVMSRNNSRDRLEPRTSVPAESELAERLIDAEPRSCLAIRLAREHSRSTDEEALLECAVCSHTGRSTCVPSLVGGEVIGSVLVEHDQPLADDDQTQIRAAVGQAAPALGNLRNLALAESRALTDALTGLPNTRAAYDTLKRMVATASRTMTPLSAVMLDLDHFKEINDSFGHEKGDQALAAVGDVLGSSARASDFVGRYGGEEFLVLLPDTGKEGALEVAEKLRLAVSALYVPGTDRPLTTSCGVATFPENAKSSEGLLRLADRGLYAAKAAGRNRVSEAALDTADAKA